MRRIESTEPLSNEETIALIAQAQLGDDTARNRVIATNMRLVHRIAKPMAMATGLIEHLDDLVASAVAGPRGNGGLIRAIAAFDPARHKRFTTVATYWVRWAVQDAINDMRGAPRGGRAKEAERVRKVRDKLIAEVGRPPTDREIKARCVLLGIDAPSDYRIEHLSNVRVAASVSVEDLPAGLGDPASNTEVSELIGQAMASLDDRSEYIVRGLNGIGAAQVDAETLAETLGITRAQVIRLHSRAMAQLREEMADER